ncbi:SDR family NAD(P)-dependent oxidoreductase [Angustibacter sp. Root456]|uniref:SDR family NAD(P)-dependent oxidoreductase n=1 Tax=Angustibacter sp. Root456 TaxID=1736539 RepID=UPI0006FE0F66|nr:SDR family NAD(P)-dependent oxidoreductase [Angustibacter sp. Root456]KQX61881.1 short-chain dehydrogenase [Angustibacter sp. Root456]
MNYQTGVGQRTAVVTGVASPRGIGYATAKRYAAEGWAVAALDIDGVAVKEAAEAISAEHGVPVLAVHVDVTSEDSVEAAARAVAESDLPPVGALANVAGLPSPVPFLEVSLDLWHRVLDVNVTGVFLLSRAFLPQMIEGGYGRVVNMSSVSAQMGGGVFSKTPYSAAKAAVLGLTRSLAREMAPHGITVNAIAPGIVDTDIRAGASDAENEARLSASVPLGRQASADEVAALYVWLSSADAAYITGCTHNINGGQYIA